MLVVQRRHRCVLEGRHAVSEGGGKLLTEEDVISEQKVVEGGSVVIGGGVMDSKHAALPRSEEREHLDVKIRHTIEPKEIAGARIVRSDSLL